MYRVWVEKDWRDKMKEKTKYEYEFEQVELMSKLKLLGNKINTIRHSDTAGKIWIETE